MMNVLKENAWCPLTEDIRIKPCPRPPNKDVLLDKFWNFVDFNRLPMAGVNREKHRFDKRWLLDVLSTFVANDEIFTKPYMPPVKASKLD